MALQRGGIAAHTGITLALVGASPGKTSKTENRNVELSLEALDVVMGGNARAPMGLGGSIAPQVPTIAQHANGAAAAA